MGSAFSLFHYESLLCKAYCKEARDLSSKVYIKSVNRLHELLEDCIASSWKELEIFRFNSRFAICDVLSICRIIALY